MTRERDRYGRASAREQLAGELRGFWANRALRTAMFLFVGGLVLLWVLTPKAVAPTELVSGDCLFLRLPGGTDVASNAAPVAGTTQQLTTVVSSERAACNLSHSHEVSTTVALPDADQYPGLAALAQEGQDDCEAAFAAYVGRPLDASRYGTAIWVPPADAWAAGDRDGVCVVFNKDRTYLDHRAAGSGE
ncbi:MAG TPA: septum formation family protein [Candidatus Limnocylindrales bacterium]|nr:septum formation family protein [Candidatus Limnocylindrales bacterium]